MNGDVTGSVDGDELVDLVWISPLEALERSADGVFDIAFPTQKTLELLASEATAVEMERQLRSLGIVGAVQPRIEVTETTARIVLPGEPGFDELADDQSDPDLLVRLARGVRGGGHVPPEFKGPG